MEISVKDLPYVLIGSYFLGSGGGLESFATQFMMRNSCGPESVKLIKLEDLQENDLVAMVASMGSPIVEAETLYSRVSFQSIYEAIERSCGRSASVFVSWGAAGGTPLLNLFFASALNVPLLDADSTGRCFPSLQMISCNVFNLSHKKAFITDSYGNTAELRCRHYQSLERHARQFTISSDGISFLVPTILTAEEAKKVLIPGSITRALEIGRIIKEERSFERLEEYTKGKLLGVGGVVSVYRKGLPKPFKTWVRIKHQPSNTTWDLFVTNEFDLLFENGEIVAEIPDIICLCNPYTCEPLTLKDIDPVMNIAIFTMKAPEIWYTERGLFLIRTELYQKGKEIICASGLVSKKVA